MPPAAARQDFARFIKSETERWADVIKSMDAAKKAEAPLNTDWSADRAGGAKDIVDRVAKVFKE